MIGKIRPVQLASVSALAVAAVVSIAPLPAVACTATSQGDVDVTSIDITCSDLTPTVVPFTTRYESEGGEIYNGNGADTLFMNGGSIVSTGVEIFTPVVDETFNLDPSTDVQMLGGNDIVDISGAATVGADGAPVDINLGLGDDEFHLSGEAVIYGSVFGNDGIDTFDLSGGEIFGSIFGNSGNDIVRISGDAFVGVDTGIGTDSVGLEDGDDEFTMTGGELEGSVSGNTGNDRITIEEGLIGSFVEGNEGNDTINISGGEIAGPVLGDIGDDDITIGGGTIDSFVAGNDGDDTIIIGTAAGGPTIASGVFGDDGADDVQILGGTIGTTALPAVVDLGAGADVFEMSGGTVTGSVYGLGGGNTFDISGGTIGGSLFAGSENDTVTISGTANIETGAPDAVGLEDGDDTFSMTGGTLGGSVSGGSGADTMTVSGGTINAFLAGNDGADAINVLGGEITEEVVGGLGDDVITIGGGTIGSTVSGDDGADQIRISGGVVADVNLGAGVDLFEMSAGTVTGSVFGLGGGNTYNISGGTIGGSVFAGSENDTVTISGTASIAGGAPDSVGLEDGDDTFTMTGGTLAGAVSGGNGADTLTISGGTVGSFVAGNAGDDLIFVTGGTVQDDVRGNEGIDRVTISGGTVAGDVEGETVILRGGTIGGDITGISNTTLIIDGSGVNPLDLQDGVVFSGTNAVGTITDEDLAAGGETQNFTGFDSVTMSASTLRFGAGAQDIGLLSLGDGSTLFVNGNTNMTGNVVVTGSTIDMIDGVADDVFTLGGLTLNGGTIGLDLNQQTGLADQLVAGAFTANGANTIVVNLLGAPVFAEPTDIPIIVSTNGPIAGTFATGITGTPSSLFTYEVIAGPDGGLFIRATPANFGIATAPDSAVNASTVETAIDALYGINDDAIESDLGLANGAQRVQISPTFGVFASGQFAHTEHDGFTISGNGLTGAGPGFDANDFSAAISLDFNAAKHFGFDDRYGLNLGVFAGYASTDVGLGAFQGFANIGDADNRSGMFGGYALFRQGVNYALVSASAFLGETDVSNGVLNTTGNYGTEGYAVTGSVGHIFSLTERVRFDLRGGILGVTFNGDDYTDSGGNQFGESRISFGAFKFEPGIYADFALENGMVLSPYARADFQQRFAYKNTTNIDSREINFDDADFSAAVSGGFNLKMTERTTVSGEVRGKFSADSSTMGGKLGLKVAF